MKKMEKSNLPVLDQQSVEVEVCHGNSFDVFRDSNYLDYLLLAGGVLFSAINGALLPLNSFIFEGIANALMEGEAQLQNGTLDFAWFSSEIKLYCLQYFYLGVAIFLFSYCANASLCTFSERRIKCIKQMYLKSVLRQNAQWFDSHTVGELTQKMSSGIEKIKDGTGDKIGILVNGVSTFIVGIIMAFYMSWQLTLLMMITVPLQLGSLYLSAKLLNKATKDELTAYSTAGGLATEVISGIKTVMAFNAQSFEIKRYSNCLQKTTKLGIRKAFILACCTAFPLLLMFIFMSVAFWYGTTLAARGILSSGAVFAVFWMVVNATRRLGESVPHLTCILNARLTIHDTFRVINEEQVVGSDALSGIAPEEVTGKISFEDVEFCYPARPTAKVLNKVSFEVNPGETFALVGHSGCGKSTSMNLLMRFYSPTVGMIKLDDVPIQEYNIRWLRNTIGIVQQEPTIFVATVAENIRMGDDLISDEDIQESCKMANAHEFICKLPMKYETVIGAGAIQLSGGQKQRIAIARAVVRKPKILVLDEATSALDAESERLVQDALDKSSQGRTTLCIAHRLSTIRNADKILVFDQGKIVVRGTHDELIGKESGIYARMVNTQEIEKAEADATLDNEDTNEDETIHQDSVISNKDLHTDGLYRNEVTLTMKEPNIAKANKNAEDATLMDIYHYALPERRHIFIAFGFILLRGLTWPLFSIVYGFLFKILSEGGDDVSHRALLNSIWFILLGITSSVSTFFSGALLGKSGEALSARLRMDVFKNILYQDGSYFDKADHSVGSLTSRLAVDAPNVQAAVDQRLAEVLTGLVSLMAGAVIAFCFGWKMAPIITVTTAVVVAIQIGLASFLKRLQRHDMKFTREADWLVTEFITNWKAIQVLTKEDYVLDKFKQSSSVAHRKAIIRSLWQSASFAFGASFVMWSFAVAYIYGLWLISNQWSTPFTVFQVIEALTMASMSIMLTASYFPEYVRARVSAGIMFNMASQTSTIDNGDNTGSTPAIRGNITMANVKFAYPNHPNRLVLNEFNLTVTFGQTIALVGPSGCGKSTTIQLLERFYDVLGGRIAVDNMDIRDISVKHLRNNIVLVGQEPTLFNLTIQDNITYGLDNISQKDIEKAATLANAHQFITMLPEGYETVVGESGGKLSGGQKQRIAIARAIIRNPKILLLDEATSALDSESEKIVQDALDRARHGRTSIVIAHRLTTIQNADKIIVCQNGKAVEEGTHQTLLANHGLYHRLVDKLSS